MGLNRVVLAGLLALNLFTLWQLNGLTAQTSGVLSALHDRVADLSARLEMLESAERALANGLPQAVDASRAPPPDLTAHLQPRLDRHQGKSNEDWFWNSASTGAERALTFKPSTAFSVQSVTCKDDWCRAEIEDHSGASGLEADLELHLAIDASLGRDTEIRFGPRQGNLRVLYIR